MREEIKGFFERQRLSRRTLRGARTAGVVAGAPYADDLILGYPSPFRRMLGAGAGRSPATIESPMRRLTD